MMALADFAMYVAVFSADRPGAARGHHQSQHQLPAQAGAARPHRRSRLLKLGKRLAVGEVTIYSDGEDEPVAHVTSTYSIPH